MEQVVICEVVTDPSTGRAADSNASQAVPRIDVRLDIADQPSTPDIAESERARAAAHEHAATSEQSIQHWNNLLGTQPRVAAQEREAVTQRLCSAGSNRPPVQLRCTPHAADEQLAGAGDRDEEGVGRIKEMTEGVGADAVLECVGSGESMLQALRSARPGGMVGWVGAPHGVDVSMADTFWRNVGVRGGPAPVRHYLPDLLDRVWNRRIDPGKVFDMELPLEQVGDAYRAMDERRAIKVLLSV